MNISNSTSTNKNPNWSVGYGKCFESHFENPLHWISMQKQTVPSAQKKTKAKYPDLSLEWKEIYYLPFTVTRDTEISEFQYKLVSNIVCTNEKLFRFKMIDSLRCAFCQTEVESSEHLFFHCDITKSFWQLLCSWISEQKVISTS